MIEIKTRLEPRKAIEKIIENLLNEYISFNSKFFPDYIAFETDKFILQFRRYDKTNFVFVSGNQKDISINDFNDLYKIVRGI